MKNILFVFIFIFCEKIKIFENYTHFIYLIKDTILGRACGGANTFPPRNRLPDLKSSFRKLALSFLWFFHSFS